MARWGAWNGKRVELIFPLVDDDLQGGLRLALMIRRGAASQSGAGVARACVGGALLRVAHRDRRETGAAAMSGCGR
jgi:hypothetical protein